MNGSYERYADLIRLYILPTFGEMQAAKLDAELLERFYARLQRCREMWSGQPRAGHTCRPLSGSTTRKIHYLIRGFRVDSDHPREESARIVGMGTFVRTSPAGVATVRSGYAGCHSPLEGGQVHEPVAR
jgi:plasmid stabilization system protein ParE